MFEADALCLDWCEINTDNRAFWECTSDVGCPGTVT